MLSGGRGRDELDGGEGDDGIVARDGLSDGVRCGAGFDSVDADKLDLVDRRLRGREAHLHRAPERRRRGR